jgi:sugar lactone lactonase YvrE
MLKRLGPFVLALVFYFTACEKPVPNPEDPSIPKKWKVTTVAGEGSASFINGPALTATFHFPEDIAFDRDDNFYITDVLNKVIRRLNAGQVTSFAGNGEFDIVNGQGTAAKFKSPFSITVDAAGNIYSSDDNDPRIRKITPAGDVTTYAGTATSGFADGKADEAQFRAGSYIAADAAGNIFVSDGLNNRIRKMGTNGQVITVAGSDPGGFSEGNGAAAKFSFPGGITIDKQNNLYIADRGNFRIRKITPAGNVSTLAGSGKQGTRDGNPGEAEFTLDMRDLVVDVDGNLYLSDLNRIRKITPQGVVSTIAGSDGGFVDGDGPSAKFDFPNGMTINKRGDIFIADLVNNRIRKLSLE